MLTKTRIMRVICLLCMTILSVLFFEDRAMAADIDVSEETVVEWCRSLIGTNGVDVDGAAGIQCVDLVRKYTQWLGKDIGIVPGNGYAQNWISSSLTWNGDYYTKYLASSGEIPQPGDIFVWSASRAGGTTGHVGIIYEVGSNYYKYIDYAPSRGSTAYEKGPKENKQASLYYYDALIRPHINRSTPYEGGPVMPTGYPRLLPDGDYIIASTLSPDKGDIYFMDIEGGSNPEWGTNVRLWELHSTDDLDPCDVWTITYENGFYTIRQKGTNIGLDVYGASTASGGNVEAWEANETSAQKFAISQHPDHKGYRIQASCSGLSVEVAGAICESGTNIRQFENNQTSAQSWQFIPYKPEQLISDGRYILLSKMDPGFEMDVPGNSADIADKAKVQIWDVNTCLSRYNSFDVKALDNGYYSLTLACTGQALEVSDSTGGYNTGLVVGTADGTSAQQWAIRKNGDAYALILRRTGMLADVYDAKAECGQAVNQYLYPNPYLQDGAPNQLWYFVPAEYTITYNANGGKVPQISAKDLEISGVTLHGSDSKDSTWWWATKYYKEALTVISFSPLRDGYDFLGWATSRNAVEAEYQPGDLFTTDADTTLYAVWSKIPKCDPPVVNSITPTNGKLVIKWNEVAGADKYAVYRKEGSGSWTAVTQNVTKPQYVDANITACTNYSYYVKAYNAAGWSNSSVNVSFTTPPAAPKTVAVTGGIGKITVAWSKVTGAEFYALYRREYNGSKWSSWTTVSAKMTASKYIDANVVGGKKYQYRARACSGSSWGDFTVSAEVQAEAPAITVPAAPETVTAKAYTAKISISWSKVDGATKYALYRRVDSGSGWGNWEKVSTAITATAYADKNVSSKSKYQYKVKAYNEAGWGALAASYPVTAK